MANVAQYKISLDDHFQTLLDKFKQERGVDSTSAVMRDLLRMWDANDADIATSALTPSAGSGEPPSASLGGHEVTVSPAELGVTDRDSYRPPNCYCMVGDARVSVTRTSRSDPWFVPLVGIEASTHPKRGLVPIRAQTGVGKQKKLHHVHTRIADNMLRGGSGWTLHDVTAELTEAELADIHEMAGNSGYLWWEQGLTFGKVPRKICLDNVIPRDYDTPLIS